MSKRQQLAVAALHMQLDGELLKDVDDYRYQNRFPARSEAVKALLRLGLESIRTPDKDKRKLA